jgi:hypothetical protein
VSILSRALSAHPENARNKVLRLAYLRAGEGIWHESKLKSEWNDALKIGGTELQMEWLEWRIMNGSNGVDGVVESAVKAAASLRGDDESEVAKVRIFWRMTIAIRSAGMFMDAFWTLCMLMIFFFSPLQDILSEQWRSIRRKRNCEEILHIQKSRNEPDIIYSELLTRHLLSVKCLSMRS